MAQFSVRATLRFRCFVFFVFSICDEDRHWGVVCTIEQYIIQFVFLVVLACSSLSSIRIRQDREWDGRRLLGLIIEISLQSSYYPTYTLLTSA